MVAKVATLGVSTVGSVAALSGLGVAFRGLIAVAQAFAVAIGVVNAVMLSFIRNNVAFQDRLVKTADKLGIGVEFLQKFRFAAEQTGVTIETADMALQRFTRRAAEAAKGTGEARGAFRQLGIQLKDNQGNLRDVEDILFDVADGIANTRSESEKVRLAFKFFDSEGVALVGTLSEGSDALRAFYNEIEDVGGVLDKVSAEGTAEFADSLTTLMASIQGLANLVVSSLAPALDEITQEFIAAIKNEAALRGGFKELGEYLKNEFIDILQNLAMMTLNLYNVMATLFNGLINGLTNFGLINNDLKVFEEHLKELEKMLSDPTGSLSTMLSRMLYLPRGAVSELFAEELGTFNLMTDETITKMIALLKSKIAQMKQSGAVRLELPVLTDERMASLLEFFDRLREKVEEIEEVDPFEGIEEVIVKAEQTLLQKLFGLDNVRTFFQEFEKEGATAIDKLGALIKLVMGEELVNNLRVSLEAAGFGDHIKTLTDGLTKAAMAFEDALTQAFMTGELNLKKFGDLLKETLVRAFIQKTITGPIGALMGLAAGGPAQAGTPYIVGEKGPELFVPNTSGTVIPNDQITNNGGMGVGGGQVTYNINAVDAPSFQALVASDPQFIYAVTQAGARTIPGSR